MSDTEHWCNDQPINAICHYTSLESLIRILEERRLRLGPVRFSNDPYESEFQMRPILQERHCRPAKHLSVEYPQWPYCRI
jgi:hypothetical protein